MKKKKIPLPADQSHPLRSKRREQFCELYAFELWGDPGTAAARAGYKLTPFRLRMLLQDPQIMARVKFLRKTLGDQTVADEAWIKNRFVEIARNADKVTDQLRALSSLYRAVVESERLNRNPSAEEDPDGKEDLFHSLSFDGEEDI
ncbi:MAG: hypothetical protein J6S58_00980 [Lentisphaeria bacterium]|nr:hypothetical protein [Lentisphaeria bacterium]